MKSLVVLIPFLFFTVAFSATPDVGLHKYLLAIPENQMAKCLKESNLEAERDKVLTDETSVDQEKLGCVLACTLKENGALINGEIKLDVFSKLLAKVFTEKEDKLEEKLELFKACMPEGDNAKNDCEKARKIVECKIRKATEMGL